MNWMDDKESLAEAMELVPFADAFQKAVKAAVKAKLEEDPDAVPGFKLRGGGNMTSYDAKDVADIIMDSNVIGWDELMMAMKFSMTPFVKIWSEHTGMTMSEAKKDLSKRLEKVQKTKPKAPSIMKDRNAK
jgi:hypothetical protein